MIKWANKCGFGISLVVLLVLGACKAGAPESEVTKPFKTSTPRPTITPTSPRPTFTPKPTPEGLPIGAALGDTWTRPADEMVMVYVPGETFMMGSDENHPSAQEDELPQHPVTLSSFWIDRTEVTNAQFALCVAAGACARPFTPALDQHADYYENSQYADYPVINVSWGLAQDYCDWVGAQLPHEAQWEYAARGPESWLYPWGNDPPNETLLNFDRVVSDTIRVGSYPQGASWCGALDMAGNVWEWVGDWSLGEDGRIVPTDNAAEPGRNERKVLRGGSWVDVPDYVRSTHQIEDYVGDRDFYNGFRCSVPLTPAP